GEVRAPVKEFGIAGRPTVEIVSARSHRKPVFGPGNLGVHIEIVMAGTFQIPTCRNLGSVGPWVFGNEVDGACERVRTVVYRQWTLHNFNALHPVEVDLREVDIPIKPADYGYAVHHNLHAVSAQALH